MSVEQEEASKTVEVSLGKAQKWLEVLKAAVSGGADDDEYGYRMRRRKTSSGLPGAGTMVVVVTPGMDTSEALAGVRREAKVLQDNCQRQAQLVEDIGDLKEVIFAANQESGASGTMSHMAFLKAKIHGLEETLSQIRRAGAGAVSLGSMDPERMDGLIKAAKKREDGQVSLVVLLADEGKTRSELQTARAELNSLDDQLRETNATHKVEVTLSRAGCEVVGV